jgi:hypothetical protein
MTTDFKQFKIYAPPSRKSYTLHDDGTLTITGVFSTTNKDLDGEIVSPQALASLQRQAVGLNLHLDHNHNYDGGIGVITESHIEANQVYITAVILSEYASGILERLNLGMNFGFSVGGIPVVNNLNPQIIDDFVLLEISLTLLPANWDTFGTVEAKGVVKSKCLTGACHYIIKNSKNIMKKEYEDNSKQELEQMVINLVNEAFANKEQVIIDEFRNELQPIVTEIVAEEVTPKVQEIVVNYLDELFPAEELVDEEFVEAEVNEEEVETSAVDENNTEETSNNEEETEEVIEEKATDEEVVEEEVIAETTEDEVPEDSEIFDEPIEIDIEKEVSEEEVPEEPPKEEETQKDEETEEVVEKDESTNGETSEEVVESETVEKPILDEKAIDLIVSRVFKKMNEKRETKKTSKKSKLDLYKKSTDKTKKSTFLNSPKRDNLGRNKKYL